MNGRKHVGSEIRSVHYQPSVDYGLNLEIIPMSALRQRKGMEYLRASERIEFHMLIYITEQNCTHTVDFESIQCKTGSILMLQPGQTHSFDATTNWQGWLIIFRPEFLLPSESSLLVAKLDVFRQLEELPIHLNLNPSEQQIVMECITRMSHDAKLDANTSALNILLQNQLHALLNRLHLIAACNRQSRHITPIHLQCFRRYRHSVEQHFYHWHRVTDYAKRLGCSEKSLSRIVQEFSGVNAKTFLSKRITLEAKRYLTNTGLPISMIAYKLGFDEATNFIKFFKREAGCSPGSFRQHQLENQAGNLMP